QVWVTRGARPLIEIPEAVADQGGSQVAAILAGLNEASDTATANTDTTITDTDKTVTAGAAESTAMTLRVLDYPSVRLVVDQLAGGDLDSESRRFADDLVAALVGRERLESVSSMALGEKGQGEKGQGEKGQGEKGINQLSEKPGVVGTIFFGNRLADMQPFQGQSLYQPLLLPTGGRGLLVEDLLTYINQPLSKRQLWQGLQLLKMSIHS
ncbi:MAG: hypothetical protein OEZ23_06965, partial [Gammaproteobacteria bacterium]|nr:hypothetical protein [Gammaproteobacteria bacterium]